MSVIRQFIIIHALSSHGQ
ncbi:hypothetical protein F383_36908 [Gossypium arboreum]|uniref:Uncharacterized protein n=1 Tax=Gossypium arboreum TaxID=29729 RepID=A0A0B0M9M9_GOSAR|nr:hypothetical protein F383_36908 [Gossypium arboreum]